MLINYAIEFGIQNHCQTFDMLRGNEAYKSEWTDKIRNTYNYQLFDERVASQVARGMVRGRTAFRQAKKMLNGLDFGF